MTNENKDSLNALIEHSIKSNWNLMALSDMGASICNTKTWR